MVDESTAAKKPTTEKITVQMSDGRTVDFNKKQKLVKSTVVADDGTVSGTFDFANGETRTFTANPGNPIYARLAAHGLEQKLGDSIAGENEIGDALLAFDDVLGRLNAGDWTATRQAGSMSGTSVLIQALVEKSGKSVEDIKAYLSNKSQAEKLALRRSAQLKPIIDRLESEKAKNSKNVVDTDALLGEILGEAAPAATSKRKVAEPA